MKPGFGLVDSTSIKRKRGIDGRLLSCEVKLSDWVFNAIEAEEVLTLHLIISDCANLLKGASMRLPKTLWEAKRMVIPLYYFTQENRCKKYVTKI